MKKIRSVGTIRHGIRSVGTTRDSIDPLDVAKALGAEPCGFKVDVDRNPLSRYSKRKYIYNRIKKQVDNEEF